MLPVIINNSDLPVQTIGRAVETCLDPIWKFFLTFIVRIASNLDNEITKTLYKKRKEKKESIIMLVNV
jgi:hypothetical protein